MLAKERLCMSTDTVPYTIPLETDAPIASNPRPLVRWIAGA